MVSFLYRIGTVAFSHRNKNRIGRMSYLNAAEGKGTPNITETAYLPSYMRGPGLLWVGFARPFFWPGARSRCRRSASLIEKE